MEAITTYCAEFATDSLNEVVEEAVLDTTTVTVGGTDYSWADLQAFWTDSEVVEIRDTYGVTVMIETYTVNGTTVFVEYHVGY